MDGDYDPTDKWRFRVLVEANRNRCCLTGHVYVDPPLPPIFDHYTCRILLSTGFAKICARPANPSMNLNKVLF